MSDEKKVQDLIDAENKRIALRDQFAATAPITLDQVLAVFGDPDADMQGDHTRVAVYTLWAMMRYEYADAMMAVRRKTMFEAAEEQKSTTAVDPQGLSVYEALRQLFGYVKDICGQAEVAYILQPDFWADQPDHPMTLARFALNAGMDTTAAGKEGWIEWVSGPCTLDRYALVDIKFANGHVVRRTDAGRWTWEAHQDPKYSIVAYRVVRR